MHHMQMRNNKEKKQQERISDGRIWRNERETNNERAEEGAERHPC